jgi:rhodanese-related sulfurtransferase
MKTFKIFIPLFLFLFSLYGCAQNGPANTLTLKELKERIKNNDSTMVILDVRTDAELTGALPKIKSALHISVQELEKRVDELEKYKDKEIVVVCRTQNRSSKAAEFLNGKGYDAKSVTGGMQEYYKK